jgi:hypothetical protein
VYLEGTGFEPDTDVSVTYEGPTGQHGVFTPADAPILHATAKGAVGPWAFVFDDPQTDVGEWTLTVSDGTCEAVVTLDVEAG